MSSTSVTWCHWHHCHPYQCITTLAQSFRKNWRQTPGDFPAVFFITAGESDEASVIRNCQASRGSQIWPRKSFDFECSILEEVRYGTTIMVVLEGTIMSDISFADYWSSDKRSIERFDEKLHWKDIFILVWITVYSFAIHLLTWFGLKMLNRMSLNGKTVMLSIFCHNHFGKFEN